MSLFLNLPRLYAEGVVRSMSLSVAAGRRSLAILLCPVLALGQAAPDKPAPPTTFQVTSRIVYVDVVVRDMGGRIVRGLTEKDFHLFEDGKPQQIDYFRDHTHDIPSAPEQATNKDGSMSFSNVDAGGEHTNSVNIILFDFFNTAPADQLYARKQMIRFLENLPPGRQTALFVLGKRLRMLQSFTGSTDRLLAAANAMKLETSSVATLGGQQQDADMAANFAAAIGRSASGINPVSDGASFQGGQDTQRAADVTRVALAEIAAAVSGYPGRKNLFWLADNFPLYGGPALELNDMSQAVAGYNLSTADMAEANRGVASAQIALYPISLAGLEVGGAGSETRGMPTQKEFARQFNQRNAMHEMLNNMADTTGGRAYYGTNDFAGALARGFEDGSSYYSLAYKPENQNWNGHFRKISVKLGAFGYSLAYRRGYYATPDQPAEAFNPSAELNAALQPDTTESTMLRLHAKVELPDAQHPAVRVDSVIDPGNVEFTTDSRGRRHAQLLVLLVAFPEADPSGDRKKDPPPKLPQTSGTYLVDLDPDAFRKLFTSGMPMHQELALPPGRYHLRLGVTDIGNHRIGTLDMPVEVAHN
jgi:VWFA-related protein